VASHKPGTDVALMMGWLRIIIEENLYDHDFVANWTVGFEDLKAAVADYTPQRVAEITWLTPNRWLTPPVVTAQPSPE